MKKLILLLCLLIPVGIYGQELGDYLGAKETKMLEMFEKSPKFTNLEIDGNTAYITFEENLLMAFTFEEGKVITQYIFYERALTNRVVKYVSQFVEMEYLKHYANFNVDPPTFYKLTWKKDMLILTLHE